MATVNLSWTVEGLHDGIRVERTFVDPDGDAHVDYLDTLPAGTTEFEDDFSISALLDHYASDKAYEVPLESIDLLTYTLTTFRGDKEKSTKVPVPVVDTDPEWIQNIIDNIYNSSIPSTVENDVLNEDYVGIVLNDSYGGTTLSLYVSEVGYAPVLSPAVLQNLSDGDHLKSDYYLPSDFDYTLLHDVDFTRVLNQGLNFSHVESPFFVPVNPDMFAGNTYVTSFAMPPVEDVSGDSGYPYKRDAIDYFLYDQLPTREVDVLYFLSAPFVASNGNHSLSGMSIWVMDSTDDGTQSKLVPWDPDMLGMYVVCVSINMVNGIPVAG